MVSSQPGLWQRGFPGDTLHLPSLFIHLSGPLQGTAEPQFLFLQNGNKDPGEAVACSIPAHSKTFCLTGCVIMNVQVYIWLELTLLMGCVALEQLHNLSGMSFLSC